MSDMPKKIWITGEHPPFWQVGEPPQIYLDATEYIRSDMAEQRIQELEAANKELLKALLARKGES